jgi:hypothetical protein
MLGTRGTRCFFVLGTRCSSVADAVWNCGGGEIAFYCGEGLSGKLGAEFVVGVAAEPAAQIFFGLASA